MPVYDRGPVRNSTPYDSTPPPKSSGIAQKKPCVWNSSTSEVCCRFAWGSDFLHQQSRVVVSPYRYFNAGDNDPYNARPRRRVRRGLQFYPGFICTPRGHKSHGHHPREASNRAFRLRSVVALLPPTLAVPPPISLHQSTCDDHDPGPRHTTYRHIQTKPQGHMCLSPNCPASHRSLPCLVID